MDSSAEDGGALPTALARGPASPDSASQSPGSQGPSLPGSASQSPGSQDSASQVRGARKPVIPEQRTAAHRGPVPAGREADKAAPRRPTDGVAIAALVSGIFAAIPVTLVLGPLALIRISRSRARGRGLAITGLVLAGLWTVAAAIVAAAIITRPPPPKPVPLPQVFSLRPASASTRAPTGSAACRCSAAPRPTTRRCSPPSGWPPRTTREPPPCSSRPGRAAPAAQRLPEPPAVRGLAGPVLRLPRRRGLVGG